MNIERHIRCKCGKYWGMRNHKRKCKRCKTEVIARGELNANNKHLKNIYIKLMGIYSLLALQKKMERKERLYAD